MGGQTSEFPFSKQKQETPHAAANNSRKKTEILSEAEKGKAVRERTKLLSQKVGITIHVTYLSI